MSLSPHQRGTLNTISKQNVEAIGETMQHSGDLFYNIGAPSLEQAHSSPEILVDSSPEVQSVYKSDKAYQVRGHFQQSGPVKWTPQNPMQTATWFQGVPNLNKWSQNFGPSLGGMDDPRAFHKGHEMEAIKLEKHSPSSSQSYTDTAHIPGEDWDHHTMAAMHHAQYQALQQGHRPADLQYQPQGMHHDMSDSTLQPFQLAFGPTKQPQAPGFQQVFQGNNASLNMNYNEKQKSQQQLLQLQQQQLHRQHQMQQLQQMRQLQQQQQQQQQHQMQQQQRLLQMQQQYQLQQMQQQLQQHAQGFQHPEPIEKQRVKQEIESQDLASTRVKTDSSQTQLTIPQTQHPIPQGADYQESGPAEATPVLRETQTKRQVLPRRSRRLSKDGVSPQGNQTSKDKVSAQNGGVGGVHGPAVGVIQSTPRQRRASKEINLETLAQKASEMELLPAKCEDVTPGRPAGMTPLVIPVSVPVRKGQMEAPGSWTQLDNVRHPSEISHQQNQPDRKPSVIVARRHSIKSSASESFIQGKGQEDKSRRRPRPEPLVIPQPCTFITPSVYSSITPYQSNLRSPVRLLDHASIIPPYTPPPILSPVREGSGLYFSAVLSSMAAGSQVLPPPSTPRSATRSLLHATSSSEITPPALSVIGEAKPVSLEPRINIGSRYQAEIPELLDGTLALQDQHEATLVWLPNSKADSTPSQDTRLDDLMNLVCSSVTYGGGTNPELAMHCLHECRGDVMEALEMMLMKNPIFSKNHDLANYHYAGSDCWTVDEKRCFNKGISAYRRDFFLVQKLVRNKTVAQCVEFYYTYKKQAKVGRNGTYTYGPLEPEDNIPVIKVKQEEENDSRQQEATQDNVDHSLQNVTKTLQNIKNERADVAHEDQKNSFVEESSGLMPATQPSFKTPSPAPPKPRSDSTGKKNRASTGNKSQGEPEGIFPCKKCSRVFYKVKSRSAHMKSHAEQEKKAAAQRREEEERAAKARQEMLEAARRKAAQRGGQEESSGAEESSVELDDEQDVDWD
ncbi:ELM2 and SANT domain-containing protein 1-like [Sinocyclocheilus grahami]|uniref:ELM2 and SANT domain-containing protein 1-like n=1 Tax=Sinocyclocheilus grahami TaxID=75366 RepID=UPI0007ACBFC4|nr:PREDICTED: ELM2 and SANT domain-containing protein 1-like [Sinocyclocheilus grahami]XP_016094133.1 PREDICTED: ELM2 and SANT domain-containing protein 1-like [Sinocyclocheilus grahami]